MEGLEGHLWTESFLRMISQSNDETKLKALQQIILHNQGEKQKPEVGFVKTSKNAKPKPPRKTIKIKATLLRNSSINLKKDCSKTEGSLNPVDTSDSSPKSHQNLIENPKTSSPKLRKPKKSAVNRSPKICKNSVSPIMGKWALLTKYNILRNSNNDAEIVTKIVMEKFKNILTNYHRRSFMRKKVNENMHEDANFDTTITNTQLVGGDNAELATADSLEATKDNYSSITYQNMDAIWEEENQFLGQNNVTPQEFKNETTNQTISVHNQLLEPHLVQEAATATDVQHQLEKMSLSDFEHQKEEKLFEDKLHYDAQQFLEEALGDELFNYSSVETTNDKCEASFLFSPPENECSSINTTQISSLYKASTYLFNVFSGKLRPHINANSPSPISYEELFADNESPPNSKASALIREAAAQNQIILQTCKALNFCENSKQFKSSKEYIEAEKILLLANLKYEVVKRELHKLDYEELKDLGQVTISNVAFPLAAELPVADEFSQWCFAVLCCDNIVAATETARIQNGDIQFNRTFHFENLDVDFEITISIYTLFVKNYVENGSRDLKLKFHIKQETTTCPTPNKLLHFHKTNKSPKATFSYEPRNSSFLLLGTTTIRLGDLTKHDPFKLTRVPNSSALKGIMTADLTSSIELTETYSGFLTVGSEAGGYATWNRRWCHLNGYQLQYWNYPAEEELTEPIGTIDLRLCVASRINQVDRELCARPRTLLLETGRLSSPRDQNSLMVLCRSSYTITKHYLSADNHQEMIKWQNQLNSVVSMLRNWNCMKCQLYFSR